MRDNVDYRNRVRSYTGVFFYATQFWKSESKLIKAKEVYKIVTASFTSQPISCFALLYFCLFLFRSPWSSYVISNKRDPNTDKKVFILEQSVFFKKGVFKKKGFQNMNPFITLNNLKQTWQDWVDWKKL